MFVRVGRIAGLVLFLSARSAVWCPFTPSHFLLAALLFWFLAFVLQVPHCFTTLVSFWVLCDFGFSQPQRTSCFLFVSRIPVGYLCLLAAMRYFRYSFGRALRAVVSAWQECISSSHSTFSILLFRAAVQGFLAILPCVTSYLWVIPCDQTLLSPVIWFGTLI